MTSTPVRIGLALAACAALVVACSSSEQSGGTRRDTAEDGAAVARSATAKVS